MWNGMNRSNDFKRRKRFDPLNVACYLVFVNQNLNLLLANALLTSAAVGF
jgi:hypothetical protein